MQSRYEAARGLFEYDATQPVSLERTNTTGLDQIRREDVAFASPTRGTVTAYLLSPEPAGTYPGLIVMHGSGGSRLDLLDQGADYARLGVFVLLIDGPSARRDGEFINFTSRDREEQIQLITDLRRAVDVLIAVGADPARIGYLGYSYGAAMGGQLAGVEPRISAYVLDVGDGGLVSHFTGPDDGGPPPGVSSAEWEAWLSLMEPIEPLYFIGHASPSVILMQSARSDENIPISDAERWHAAASDPREVMWYDSGHWLPPQAWCDQADWLRGYLEFAEGALLGECA
jgi:dipeptidyl aminopeptidase/acylaminoacyl peptidase